MVGKTSRHTRPIGPREEDKCRMTLGISFLITNKGRVGDTALLIACAERVRVPMRGSSVIVSRDKVEEMLEERSTQSSTTGDCRQSARLDCPVNRQSSRTTTLESCMYFDIF